MIKNTWVIFVTTTTPIKKVEELYFQYAHDIYRLALFSTRNHTEAEDIVQEVFLRIHQNWSCFRGDSDVRTWIWRITQNYIVDVARKRKRNQRMILDVLQNYYPDSIDTLVEVEWI